jgi:dipeptidyl aminopeptidase/acylaminoacyl peptidase
MRDFVRGALGAVAIIVAASVPFLGPASYAPLPELASAQAQEASKNDYRSDRARFRTRLLRTGRSPQRYAAETPPPGVTEVRYPSGAFELKAWVGMPARAQGRLPVVIFLHGGFAFGAEDFTMAEPFRAAGYVVVTPILRGENGLPGAFTMYYDEIDDVLAAADYVRAQPYADPERIYLAGHSVGGTHALLAAMASPQFRAVASFSGSPDQFAFINSEPWSRIAPFDRSNSKELEMRSPLVYATSLKSPTRLFFGTGEPVFRASTRRLVERAKAAGLDVDYSEIPGDHFGSVPEAIQRSIAFFRSKS